VALAAARATRAAADVPRLRDWNRRLVQLTKLALAVGRHPSVPSSAPAFVISSMSAFIVAMCWGVGGPLASFVLLLSRTCHAALY